MEMLGGGTIWLQMPTSGLVSQYSIITAQRVNHSLHILPPAARTGRIHLATIGEPLISAIALT
jgi:hypothetical protein